MTGKPYKHGIAIACAASALSLAVAFISQYGFGLKPCELCIAQRIPYAAVILLGLIALWKPKAHRMLLIIIGFLFLVECGIASYHTSVEKHWIPGPTACTSEAGGDNQSVDDFLARIKHAPIIACDQPQWEFHGVTMAMLNVLWSFLLALMIFVALRQSRKKEVQDA